MTGTEAILAAVDYIEQHPDEYDYSRMVSDNYEKACILGRATLIKTGLTPQELDAKYYLNPGFGTSNLMGELLDLNDEIIETIGFTYGSSPSAENVREFVTTCFVELGITIPN